MTVYLNLDVGAGGSPDNDIEHGVVAAARTGLWVKMKLNGVNLLIAPTDNEDWIKQNWRKALERGVDFASSNVVPERRIAK